MLYHTILRFTNTWSMKTASVANIKTHLGAYLKAAASDPVVVTKDGKPVAVLLGVQDEEQLERLLLAHSRRFQAIINAARKRFQEGKGIPHEDFWREVKKRHAKSKPGQR
jgi:prevent-host-death family protein